MVGIFSVKLMITSEQQIYESGDS